ncbi:formylmethanofuran dehydrogenase subunit E family protein [Thermodesulfobacteriota bacterium]
MKESRVASISFVGTVWKTRVIILMACFTLLVLTTAADAFAQGQVAVERHIGSQGPERYYPEWLAEAPYTPAFYAKDTMHKYGRYDSEAKQITIKDLIKFHGHLCGGLVEASCALSLALQELFEDGIIDRTDLRIVSNNSACGADVASYLTGARVRFASHSIDKQLKGGGFVVQRISKGQTVRVWRNPAVYPTEVKAQMKKIQSEAFGSEDIDLFGRLQWGYAKRLVNNPLKESFFVEKIPNYQWPEPICKDLGDRTDNNYKNAP